MCEAHRSPTTLTSILPRSCSQRKWRCWARTAGGVSGPRPYHVGRSHAGAASCRGWVGPRGCSWVCGPCSPGVPMRGATAGGVCGCGPWLMVPGYGLVVIDQSTCTVLGRVHRTNGGFVSAKEAIMRGHSLKAKSSKEGFPKLESTYRVGRPVVGATESAIVVPASSHHPVVRHLQVEVQVWRGG